MNCEWLGKGLQGKVGWVNSDSPFFRHCFEGGMGKFRFAPFMHSNGYSFRKHISGTYLSLAAVLRHNIGVPDIIK